MNLLLMLGVQSNLKIKFALLAYRLALLVKKLPLLRWKKMTRKKKDLHEF